MVNFGVGNSRGVLHRLGPNGRFHHARIAPGADLAPFVQHFWTVRWDLEGHPPQLQETLPHPNVYMIFERGYTGIHGIASGKFSRMMEGRGFVFGVKFRCGGFYPFFRKSVSELTDTSIPMRDVFGAEADALEPAIFACADEYEMIDLAAPFLRARLPAPDPEVDRIADIVAGIAEDRSITKVDDLIAHHGLSKRALQRLFNQYVGIGPKWVINRYRLHEAVEQLADGDTVDWAALALDLGYFDQAHFIRDFKKLVGRSPADYARSVRMPSA